jgi:hypothetical protein
MIEINAPMKFSSEVIIPKLEYCYYVHGQLNEPRLGIGLGVNKFFNSNFGFSDFDPFNIYVIGKIVSPPINDTCNLSFGTNQ